MTEEELLDLLVLKAEVGSYTPQQRKRLVFECWQMLEPPVKRALEDQLIMDQTGQITIDGVSKEGIAQFIESMKRLQNSFSANDMEEAIENFRAVDKSKYSLEQPLFNDEFTNSLKSHPLLEKAAAGISTQLATVTSSQSIDNEHLSHVMPNLLMGLLTKRSIIYSRSSDKSRIDNHGQVHPSLVIAAADFAKENINHLKDKTQKEIRSIGEKLKANTMHLDLSPNNKRTPLIAKVKDKFSKIKL